MATFTKTHALQSHLMETLAQNGFIDTDEALKPENAKFIQRVLDKFCERISQAQHEATWAMAMEKAEDRIKAKLGITSRALPIIRAIPCPPLQTTNEKCEK